MKARPKPPRTGNHEQDNAAYARSSQTQQQGIHTLPTPPVRPPVTELRLRHPEPASAQILAVPPTWALFVPGVRFRTDGRLAVTRG